MAVSTRRSKAPSRAPSAGSTGSTPVEIGREGEVGRGLAVAPAIGGLAFGQSRPGQGQGRSLGANRRLGMATQVSDDRPRLRLADPCRQLRRGGLGEGGQVRERGADRRVALPEASTFGGFGVG